MLRGERINDPFEFEWWKQEPLLHVSTEDKNKTQIAQGLFFSLKYINLTHALVRPYFHNTAEDQKTVKT